MGNKIQVMVIRPKGKKNTKVAYYELTFLKSKDASHIKEMYPPDSQKIVKFQKQVAKDLNIPAAWVEPLVKGSSFSSEDGDDRYGAPNMLEQVLDKAERDMRLEMASDVDLTGIFEIMVTFYNGGSRQSSQLDFQYIGPPKNRKPPKKFYKIDFTDAHGTKYDGKVIYIEKDEYDKEMKKYHAKMLEIVGFYKGIVEASRNSHKNYYDNVYKKHSILRAISDWKIFGDNIIFPDLSIWDEPTGYIKDAERWVKMDSSNLAMTSYAMAFKWIKMFEDSYNRSDRTWRNYRKETQKGAENTVVILQVTKEASFTILQMVLAPQVAGLAKGGIIVKSLVEAGVGTAITAIKEGASSAAESHYGTSSFNWKDFAKKLAIGGAAGFAGGLVSNYKYIWVSKLYKEIGVDIATASGKKLTEMEIKDYILKTLLNPSFGEGWAAGKAVEAAIKKLEGKSQSNIEDFIGLLIKDILDTVGVTKFKNMVIAEMNKNKEAMGL